MFDPANTSDPDTQPVRKRTDLGFASHLIMGLQLFMIIIFARCTKMAVVGTQAGTITQGYFYFGGVEIMMFIGFGYLMTFMKTYGLGAVGFTMLVTAIGLQWYILCEGFFHQLYHHNSETEWTYIEIDIYKVMNCLFGVSAVLISFGAIIGKVKPSQLVVMTILELIFHAFNYECIILGGIKISDIGGTYADHMFGAYFGLAVSYMLTGYSRKMQHQNVTPATGYVYDMFSLIGTLFLWIYWPSFVGGGATADSQEQNNAIINTIIALSASTMVTFWLSFHVHGWLHTKENHGPHRIFRPVDIQNATLAGGVAIGCTANLTMNPVNAIFIGFAAGLISTLGYFFIQPFLFEKLQLHDTCGVHNLHAMPSVVGAVSSIILAAYKQAENRHHDTDNYFGFENGQWWRQFVGMIAVLGCAIITGIFTGWVMRNIDPISVHDRPYDDSVYWETADGFEGGVTEPEDRHDPEVGLELAIPPVKSPKREEEGKRLEHTMSFRDSADGLKHSVSTSGQLSPRGQEGVADSMLTDNNSLYMSA